MRSSGALLQVRLQGCDVFFRHATRTVRADARCWRSLTPFSLSFAAASNSDYTLREARRYQRSTPTRVRSSTWKEKTARYDRLREEQAEAEEAARRRARAASGAANTPSGRTRVGSLSTSTLQSSFWRPKRAATSSSSPATSKEDDAVDRLESRDGGDPAAMPRQGVWYFLRGGERGRFKAPMNPLHALKKKSDDPDNKHNPDVRATQRLLHVVDELRLRSKKNQKDPITMQLSEEQRRDIANQYAETRWYARLYRPFRHVTQKQIKWTRRLTIAALVALSAFLLGCCFYVYYQEMKTVMALSEEDRQDYLYMVNGMRYSDIFFFAQDVLRKEDPLNALPHAARFHIVIEACRKKGWHTADWDLELRRMHPHSALADMDIAHMFYWTCMLVGNTASGGGALFSTDRVDEMFHIKDRARQKEMGGRFVEAGPAPAPERGRRGFFG